MYRRTYLRGGAATIAGLSLSELSGHRYQTLRVGSIGALSAMIEVIRALSPASDALFPAWQGMQYLRDMMSGRGQLQLVDNDRYGIRPWTSAQEVLAGR